jgi:hypothetical protein
MNRANEREIAARACIITFHKNNFRLARSVTPPKKHGTDLLKILQKQIQKNKEV